MKYKKYSNNKLLSTILFFNIFSIIYNISLSEESILTSARLSIIILLVSLLFLSKKKIKVDIKTLILLSPIPYVLIQYFFVNDFNQLSRFLHLAVYSYLGAILVSTLIDDIKNALLMIFLSIALQAVIIILSFINHDVKEFIGSSIYIGGNFTYEDKYRGVGLSSTAGAALSVIQSMGILTGYLLLTIDKSLSLYKKLSIIMLILIIFVSTIFTGRTGMLMTIAFTVLFFNQLKSKEFFLFILLILFLTPSLMIIFENSLANDFSTDYFYKWAFGFFTGNDQTLSAITEMPIPPLSLETLFGTGLSGLINGSNSSGHDSGFIQTYYSIGLFMSVFFFSTYLYVLNRALSWLDRKIALSLVIIFFSIEFKEPFIFKYSHMFIILLIWHVIYSSKSTKLSR